MTGDIMAAMHKAQTCQRLSFEEALARFRSQQEIERLYLMQGIYGDGEAAPAAARVARSCAYCGRPAKATARRGDGCEGCGAALGLAS